ncbi:dipeptidase [Pikeienuella sp. HZG-20]|uniref:dipeptidase n=1 Tax=Paludibacillus litoralis TaxID=3133267 RepID=UPI0030EB9D53
MTPIDPKSLPRGLPGAIARIAERVSNRTDLRDLPFHEAASGLFIADLHADTLLWGIEPLAPRSGGHLDGPRLSAAGVGLQVFAAPTWTPLPFRTEDSRLVVNARGFDQSHALFPTEIFSPARRRGLTRRSRALRIARRFDEMVEASQDRKAPFRAIPIRAAEDFDKLTPRGDGRPEVGVMLALEGVHWLRPDSTMERVEDTLAELHGAGFRMMAPTHRFSNGLGGSNEDSDGRIGLTAAGRRFVNACLRRRIVLDLAHASSALIREACGMALTQDDGPRPVILSHCGVKAVHPISRNLSVADIRSIASTGGLIGIGFWRGAMGWRDDQPFEAKMRRIVDSFAAALAILSAEDFVEEMHGRYGRYDPYEHLAFGSDFDGAVTTAFDTTGISHVVAALAAATDGAGAPLFPPEKLALVAGENSRRVLRAAMS